MVQGTALALAVLLAAGSARAGGHFDVDDAGTLDPGQCQYEVWAGHLGGASAQRFQHLGPSCRFGPIEWGLNLDRAVSAGATSLSAGPQFKWTFFGQAADAPLSAALSGGAVFDATHGRSGERAGGQFVVPVSWQAAPTVLVHVNLGSDWAVDTGTRTGRGGVAGEWALNPTLSLIAERNRAFAQWTTRAGLRVNVTQLVSVDFSVARIGPEGAHSVVLGLNHAFDRMR